MTQQPMDATRVVQLLGERIAQAEIERAIAQARAEAAEATEQASSE